MERQLIEIGASSRIYGQGEEAFKVITTHKLPLMELEILHRIHHPYLLHGKEISFDPLEITLPRAKGDLISVDCKENALLYLGQIALALDALHDQNIIHCDVKPENILVFEDHVKLADFGLARLYHPKATRICGSPNYLAPEILKVLDGGEDFAPGPSIDVWGLGITFFYLISTPTCFLFLDDDSSILYKKIKCLFSPENKRNFIKSYISDDNLVEILDFILTIENRPTIKDVLGRLGLTQVEYTIDSFSKYPEVLPSKDVMTKLGIDKTIENTYSRLVSQVSHQDRVIICLYMALTFHGFLLDTRKYLTSFGSLIEITNFRQSLKEVLIELYVPEIKI